MTEISFEDIVSLHDKILSISGGRFGISDENMIKSALSRPFSGTSDGLEFYKDLFYKAAALTQSLSLNHGFVDGNKRTALAAGMLLLFRNGYYFPMPSVETATEFMLKMVDKNHNKRLTIDEIAEWFKTNSKTFEDGYSEEYLKHIDLQYYE